MIKFFALLNLAGLFLFRALFLTDVVITYDAPATMQAGTEVRVTVNVNKEQLSGFAKLQLDLPEGLTATAIETKGASFTFAEGKAKFIWMALPAQPQFKVTFTLSAAANAVGSLPITGKFSYIEENERKTKDLPSATVTITGTPVVAQEISTPTTPIDPAISASDVAFAGTAAPIKDVTPITATGIAPQQGKGDVAGSRTITAITETEMLVEVIVKKGDIRGFGKLQETIPAGFTALEKSNDEAIFTCTDRIVKFVWLNLPAKTELKVTYKLRANSQPEGAYTVNGEFGYLLNDQTQKAVIGSTTFPTGPKAMEAQLAANNAAHQGQEQGQGQQHTEQTTTAQNTTTTQQNTAAQNSTQQQPANTTASAQTHKHGTGVPSPETGVTYKVQISAAHREVGTAYFADRHHYTGEFSIEHHEGWIKYVTGHYSEYRGARDQRQAYVSAGHNFPGPFVTAYNNGDRVTVQEALMISNQKWLQ